MIWTGDKDPLQVWKMKLNDDGVGISGEVLNKDETSKGTVRGWRSGHFVVIEYRSNPGRPGFGWVVLRQKLTASSKDPAVYEGTAMVHDCLCSDDSVTSNGEIVAVPAVLSDRAISEAQMQTALKRQTITVLESLPLPSAGK
jgi:hypothetical protein